MGRRKAGRLQPGHITKLLVLQGAVLLCTSEWWRRGEFELENLDRSPLQAGCLLSVKGEGKTRKATMSPTLTLKEAPAFTVGFLALPPPFSFVKCESWFFFHLSSPLEWS